MTATKAIPEVSEKDKRRFWSKVKKGEPDDCWTWEAGKTKKGYGHFHLVTGDYQTHRVSWFLAHGEDPGENLVLHSCDNPPCVNPAHLHLGDDKINAMEKIERGRGVYYMGDDHYARKSPEKLARGTRHGMSKLTESIVLAIRDLHSRGETQDGIAIKFGICQRTVHCVVYRKTWAHI